MTVGAEERFWGKVEKTATCWTWTACKDGCGYGMFYVGSGKRSRAHRYAYELLVGSIPVGMVLDHTCHNASCVRPDHLRLATIKANADNRFSANLGTKSGVRGVSWSAKSRKWRATIGHNYKMIYLGEYETIAEAAAAVMRKRHEIRAEISAVGRDEVRARQ